MKRFLLVFAALSLIVALTTAASGGCTASARTDYSCWDQGSGMNPGKENKNPDPHVAQPSQKQLHPCSKEDFIAAGWQPGVDGYDPPPS